MKDSNKKALLRELKAFAIGKGKEIPKEKYIMDWTDAFLDDVLGRSSSPIFINPGRNPNGILFAKWKNFILNRLEGISQSDFDKNNETEDILVEDIIKEIGSIK